MYEAENLNWIMTANTPPGNDQNGLLAAHSYTVLSAHKILH